MEQWRCFPRDRAFLTIQLPCSLTSLWCSSSFNQMTRQLFLTAILVILTVSIPAISQFVWTAQCLALYITLSVRRYNEFSKFYSPFVLGRSRPIVLHILWTCTNFRNHTKNGSDKSLYYTKYIRVYDWSWLIIWISSNLLNYLSSVFFWYLNS